MDETQKSDIAEATKEAIKSAQENNERLTPEQEAERVQQILNTPIDPDDAARQLADLDMKEAWTRLVRERALAELTRIDHQLATIECARAEIKVRMLAPRTGSEAQV